MAPSNLAVLTQSHKAIAAKRRAKKEQIKEILFDEDARRDFLTGFHKRKLEKKEAAKKKALEREKQERLEARREKRQMLAERARSNAAAVEKAYGAIADDSSEEDSEWHGLSSQDKGKSKADEYEDEEQLATVTVVEDFDPDTFIYGLSGSLDSKTATTPSQAIERKMPSSAPADTWSPPKQSSSSTSKGKIRSSDKIKYQTKQERLYERKQQKARKKEKAELAGGKASRKTASKMRRRKAK